MPTRHIHPHELAPLGPEAAYERLDSGPQGLGADERANRAARFGRNTLPERPDVPLAVRFLKQFASPFVFLLLAVAVIALWLGERKDAVVIGVVLVFNAAIGTFYSVRASRALHALKNEVVLKARCLTEGSDLVCDVRDLVPGDVVTLTAGDRIPADGRWVATTNVRVNESNLTGESVPISKTHEPVVVPSSSLTGDLRNAGYAGTLVVAGTGTLLVSATGAATEIGKIALSLVQRRPEAPLIKRIRTLSHQVLIAVSAVAIVLLLSSFWNGQPVSLTVPIILALIVSVIPEGLPIVLTIVLARGVMAMSRRKAVVKELSAVESLGGVDIIFTDKTGTLTQNVLRLTDVALADGTLAKLEQGRWLSVHGNETAIRRFAGLLAAVADPHAHGYGELMSVDPVDRAFTDLPRVLKLDTPVRHAERPFDTLTHTRAVSTTLEDGTDLTVLAGAPERVLARCAHTTSAASERMEKMAAEGLRVIAFASAPGRTLDRADGSWTFEGFAGLLDEARPEAKEAIAWCRAHRIRVMMVTGDHPETAYAIARDLGLADKRSHVVRGEDLILLPPDQLAEALGDVTVIARATPEMKMQFVTAARQRGHLIAMTGDGVNDAPALHAADVGIAMGKGGTDVAREAADLVLTDDDFATIVGAVQEGRSVVANVEKVTTYLFSTSAAEVIVIGSALAFSLPPPLLPVQILWLNLVTDGFLDVALATEPTHGGHTKPPRGRLLTTTAWQRIALLGGVMGIVGTYAFLRVIDFQETQRFAMVLLVLCALQWWNAWSARSATRSLIRLNPFGNKTLIVSTAVVVSLMVAALYWPPLSSLLRIEPVPFSAWLYVVPLGASVLLVDELWKWARRARA